ncbi:MAG: patatin-like phospholipase family protein, partial [Nitrospira sp.]|nr:patatin-like phospholipase family protein [Nitrospira sp.]
MSEHLKTRMTAEGPKKILALDGGGIRGMMTVEILAEIERMLRERLKKGPEFRLAHFFDFVAGTSTGAIIAACISVGMSVPEIRDFYIS